VTAGALDRAAPALTALAAVAATAFADGGYFPRAWGWSGAGLALVAAAALVGRERTGRSRLELVSLAGLAGLAAWALLSTVWSENPEASRLEAERGLVYVAGLAALLLVTSRAGVPALLAGVAGAAVLAAGYGLARRLADGTTPDAFEGTLLFRPLGYANAAGILAAVGGLLALGFLVHGGARSRIAAAAGLAVLLPALALTESRGAWVSGAVGLLAMLALGPARRRPALATVAAAAATAVVLTALATTGLGGDRPSYWRVARELDREEPLLGTGAGTFGDYWLALRPIPSDVRDAHSLYLETLAELGPVGLALLLAALAPPAVATARAGSRPLVAAAAGAYAAFLLHAGIDWDWEMPAVTLAGLGCAAALLASGRRDGETSLSPAARAGAIALALSLAVLAVAGYAADARS
jgi:O-antigen ligase